MQKGLRMRVLTTGATGFIGAKLTRGLAERGDEVTALMSYRPGRVGFPGAPRRHDRLGRRRDRLSLECWRIRRRARSISTAHIRKFALDRRGFPSDKLRETAFVPRKSLPDALAAWFQSEGMALKPARRHVRVEAFGSPV